jgi:hypothetical protein
LGFFFISDLALPTLLARIFAPVSLSCSKSAIPHFFVFFGLDFSSKTPPSLPSRVLIRPQPTNPDFVVEMLDYRLLPSVTSTPSPFLPKAPLDPDLLPTLLSFLLRRAFCPTKPDLDPWPVYSDGALSSTLVSFFLGEDLAFLVADGSPVLGLGFLGEISEISLGEKLVLGALWLASLASLVFLGFWGFLLVFFFGFLSRKM